MPLTCPDASSFLGEFDADEPGIIIVDVRMPGMSGFQLQEHSWYCADTPNTDATVAACRLVLCW